MVGAVSADAISQGSITSPAVIGKLPGHGDFLARSVAFPAREPLDRWMSQWIELARAELGTGFEEAYSTAAPWLFEGRTKSAVLMPSVDAVGRLFPVLAICRASTSTQSIYDTLIDVIEQSTTIDILCEQLKELDAKSEGFPVDPTQGWFLPEGAERILPIPSATSGWAEIQEHFA